jgi:hypothetical protein
MPEKLPSALVINPGAEVNFPSIGLLSKNLHFSLAKGWVVPSLPLPCQESLEKQRHGKPLPSVSKSLELGRYSVVNKAHATCCKARTASGNAGWAKRASFPMLTLETSGRTFLFPVN